MDDEPVAGMDTQRGRFKTGVGDVAKADASPAVGRSLDLHRNFKPAVVTVKFRRRRNDGAVRVPEACLVSGFRALRRGGGELRWG